MNTPAADFLKNTGCSGLTFAFEDDIENIKKINTCIETFLFAEFQPPLFRSRAFNPLLNAPECLIESIELEKKYKITKMNNLFITFPVIKKHFDKSALFNFKTNIIKQ